jgi:hypothetical protein
MRIQGVLGFCFALIIFGITGCQRDSGADQNVEIPDDMTLYSIDGRDGKEGKRTEPKPKTDEDFHGYPVLGKIAVTDAATKQAILTALNEGIASKDAKEAKCFNPRHGLRTVNKGKTIEYVICFECGQVYVTEGDTTKKHLTSTAPQAVFDKYLKEAGIPLAPK